MGRERHEAIASTSLYFELGQDRTYAGTLYVVVLGRTQLIGEDKRIEPERVSLNSSRERVRPESERCR